MTNKNKPKQKNADKQNAKAYARRQKNNTIGPMQTLGSVAGSLAGSMFGPLGSAAGFAIGSAIGNGVGYYTGTGDYRTVGPATNAVFRNPTGTVITHREYITDVTAPATPSAFNVSKYPLNPGSTQTFPWLASIAANYEEYEIIGMVFTYIPTSGEYVSTGSSLGTVIMATEYDPTKPDFATKQAMENYQFSTSAKPSVPQVHAIECKRNLSPVKQLYVRTGTSTGTDIRWSDFGNFFLATSGLPAGSTSLGELWCTYKIRLHKPRLPITVGLGGQIASAISTRTGVTNTITVGTSTLRAVGSIPITFPTTTSFAFPITPGAKYIVSVYVYGTGITANTFNGHSNSVYYAVQKAGVQTGTSVINSAGTESFNIAGLLSTATDTDQFCEVLLSVNATSSSIDVTVTQIDNTD